MATGPILADPIPPPPPFYHPALGTIRGISKNGAYQYLGIKYATLENRFAVPRIMEYDGNGEINATMHGAPVVSPEFSYDMEAAFIHQALRKDEVPPISDCEGLNLNLTIPTSGSKDLPVVVYIHGGGFAFGSSWYPHYDQSKVISLAEEMNQSIIGVNFNYRLGIPGFLTSKEFESAGITANRGLQDIRVALQWVQRYISGFGGDPDRITVVGQSAGGAAINYLLHSDEPLFNQAMLLGGTFLMMRPDPQEITNKQYQAIVNHLDLQNLEPAERINALLTMPYDRFVTDMAPEMMSLTVSLGGPLAPGRATFANLTDDDELPLPGRRWCKRVFTLDSQFDGSIIGQSSLNELESGIKERFCTAMAQSLGEEATVKILEQYELASETSDSEALLKILQIVTDIAFFAPSFRMAELFGSDEQKWYMGFFNERNPWDGIYQGRANHLLDVSFMWGNYNQSYPARCWTVARALAETLINFTSAKDDSEVRLPRLDPAVGAEKRMVTIYGPSDEGIDSNSVELGDPKATQRSLGIFKLGDQTPGGLDALLDAIMAFL
ncbi:alpha/beta-hydrolase [Penicillium brevicompactum]|uniref:Carboxylic ester hydrolase n=1 Tax=Penicillium brevicompactum TaxID=5074 RepID=A0A9W9RKC8_PENBR|nr:alpha/beta-hydrolase [Penicillium brevicompactum]